GLVTIAQKQLDWMLGYSSVMHMGYIFLGIASANILGTTGAAALIFAHGLSIALLFAIAGQIRNRTGTLAFAELGGLAKAMPFAALAFGFATFAAIGLPGFANFASEIMIFFGAIRNGWSVDRFHLFEIAVLVLGMTILMFETFAANIDKKTFAYAGIVGLVAVLIASFFLAGSPTQHAGAFWNFYSTDTLSIFFKRFMLVTTIIVLLMM